MHLQRGPPAARYRMHELIQARLSKVAGPSLPNFLILIEKTSGWCSLTLKAFLLLEHRKKPMLLVDGNEALVQIVGFFEFSIFAGRTLSSVNC